MSDEFSKCSWSFKHQIADNQPEIHYAARADTNNIIFAVDIPFPLLRGNIRGFVKKKSFCNFCIQTCTIYLGNQPRLF